MLHTYAPMNEYGEEGAIPYLAIQFDDEVYNAVEEFKEKGTFTDSIEITTLFHRFYFKAKMKYYEFIMSFYALDHCDGLGKQWSLHCFPESVYRYKKRVKTYECT